MWTIDAAKSACVGSVASSHEEYCQNGHRCCHARRKGAQTGAYKPEPQETVALILCGANCDPATVA